MLALVAALFLTSPTPLAPAPVPLKHCVRFCREEQIYAWKGTACYYEELRTCRRHQVECVDSEAVSCEPWMVNLGTWDPVPIDAPSTPNVTTNNYYNTMGSN